MNPEETKSYKEMMEMVQTMKESADLLKNMIYSSLEGDGFNISKIEELHKTITVDDIMNQPDDTIRAVFDSTGDFDDETIRVMCKTYAEIEEAPKPEVNVENPDTDFQEETAEELEARMKKFDDEYEDTKYSYMKKVLSNAFNQMNEVDKTYAEVDELKKVADDTVESYVKYLTSEEYQNKKKERLEVLKKEADECTDPKEKAKSLLMIETLEASMNLTFIIDHIERIGKKEYKAIEDNFFDNARSNYNLQRFEERIVKFGYKKDIYSHFFNIEEKFLDEKYHVFNNLFLFYIIRFVAYADPYSKKDKLFVQSLMSNTGNLIYHKFSSEKQKETFLTSIMEFLDHFEESRDRFNEKNILHPNHPDRIAKRTENDNNVRSMINLNLEEMGVEITQEIKDFTMDELREFYDGVLDDREKNGNAPKSDLSELIDTIKANSEEAGLRKELRSEYLKLAEMTDEMNEVFNRDSIDKLKEIVEELKKVEPCDEESLIDPEIEFTATKYDSIDINQKAESLLQSYQR